MTTPTEASNVNRISNEAILLVESTFTLDNRPRVTHPPPDETSRNSSARRARSPLPAGVRTLCRTCVSFRCDPHSRYVLDWF
ncbi:hypothetical protein BN903_30 [Halorubrum sp. AJ67]|nr:hypothetical protein BN903_30 [Halorubrum sp. AJ67]